MLAKACGMVAPWEEEGVGGGRPMGRYPFLTFAYRYPEEARAYVDESTSIKRKEKLKRLNKIFMGLRYKGQIVTTGPKRSTEEEAREFGGWRGERGRFLCAMYTYTGPGLSELRIAQRSDLNERNWTVWVRHSKGEHRYGRQRTAPIPPPIHSAVIRYLKARKERLRKYGLEECEQLIPKITKGVSMSKQINGIWQELDDTSAKSPKLEKWRMPSGYILNRDLL